METKQELKKEYLKAFNKFKNSEYYRNLKKLVGDIVLNNKEPYYYIFSNYPLVIAGLDCVLSSYMLSEIALEKNLKNFSIKKFIFKSTGNAHFIIYDKEKEVYHDFGYLMFNIKKEKDFYLKEEKRIKDCVYFFRVIIDERNDLERIEVINFESKKVRCYHLVEKLEIEEFYKRFFKEKSYNLTRKNKFYIIEKEKDDGLYKIKTKTIKLEELIHHKKEVEEKIKEINKKLKIF